MDWTQVLTIVGANLVILIGMLGTYVALYLHTDKKLEIAMKGIQEEMKDFHGRLCAIEENRKRVIYKE